MTQPSFTCPICRFQSFNPTDVAEQYCARCHAFVAEPAADGEFSVCQFFPDEHYEYVARFIDGKAAVELAAQLSKSVGARSGITRRIIIVDGLDNTVFEWRFGEGITFPPEAVGKVAR
jgi:hypothetical protein